MKIPSILYLFFGFGIWGATVLIVMGEIRDMKKTVENLIRKKKK